MNEMIVLQIGTSHPQGRGLLIHYCTGSNISSICGCSSAEAVLHCVSLRPELFVVSGFSLTVYVQLGLWLAVWLSGNMLASINVVALRQTRLVLGWVTVCGRVNHLGM